MGEETIKRVLRNSGLTEREAEVYIFLSKHDARKGAEIAQLLKKDKAQIFRILKRLQTKGFVEATFEFPSRLTAVPFENVLNSLVKTKQEEVAFIKKTKKDLLNYLGERQQVEPLEKFVVIKGTGKIFSKISQIVSDTKRQLSVANTFSGLTAGDQFGIFAKDPKYSARKGIQFRFLSDLLPENLIAAKVLVEKAPKTCFNLRVRNQDLGLSPFPRMVIKDDEEILFFTSRPDIADNVGNEEVCLWTNCKSLVQAFGTIFEDLWSNSRDIREKIVELESGQPTLRTLVLSDAETAKKKYFGALRAAKEEVLLMTSSKGLNEHWSNRALLKKWEKSHLRVKMMAPIARENSEAAHQLQKAFAVKHIPENLMVATIVDGKHLFQFRTHLFQIKLPEKQQERLDAVLNFEKLLYTTDSVYVRKIKANMEGVWNGACELSTVGLESVDGPSGPFIAPVFDQSFSGGKLRSGFLSVKPPGALTEKEVLNKILQASKTARKDPLKNVSRRYGSNAWAAVFPPRYLNLPSMVFRIEKIEKQSTFGAEDALAIHCWLETPNGRRCLPVAIVGDNPKAQAIWKAGSAGTPAAQNVRPVSKDELQIRIHGNTLFAGWTVPIPLYPLSVVLPPACLLIEGYGDVKTRGFTVLSPSGFKSEIEENYFDAFVTFIHPSSKYSGPGTDALFVRDFVAVDYPPNYDGKFPE